MKEMFYSEALDKYFDNKQDCRKAELEYQLAKEKAEQVKKQQAEAKEQALVEKNNEKKELANAINEADAKLRTAYQELELAKEKVRNILEESNKQALEILNPAKEAVAEAQRVKYKAVADFNKKFGVFTTTLTGDRAYEELQRTFAQLGEIFNTRLF